MPYKNKDKNREYQRRWGRKHQKEKREYRRKIRKKVLEKLGGKCVYCGCDIPEALELNHKNGGGNKESKLKGNISIYLAILNGSRKTDDLELTCRVCNGYYYLKEIKKIKGNWKITWIPETKRFK